MEQRKDDRILKLKKEIENQKIQIKERLIFNPKTNCVLRKNTEIYSINALSKEQLVLLLLDLNTLRWSAKDLNIKNVKISGFDLSDWIKDIQNKLLILERKSETAKLAKLANMELKLKQLLSNYKKVELEIDEIEEMLKN